MFTSGKLALRPHCRGLVTKVSVMEPKLIEMNGRRYRIFQRSTSVDDANEATPQLQDSDPSVPNDNDEDNRLINVEIAAKGPGYTHSFYVPKPFFGFIIGAKGATLRKLEHDTKTSIRLPRINDLGDVEITSGDPARIVSARDEIASIVEQSRKKMRTHFLAIPLRDECIASNFEKFKSDVLTETGKDSKGVKEGLFQKPEKMHLTIGGMLVLVDDDEIERAIEALRECRETIIKPITDKYGAVKIKVQGLESFDNDPTKVRVLFGRVTSENDVLQELAEKIVEFFTERGLMKREKAKVTLHMTVMNSSFMADKNARRFQPFEKWDATEILKVHRDFTFGETTLRTIHICKLGPKAEDGYYQITSRINLDE